MLATLEGSPILEKMETEWETIAKALNVPSDSIEGIRADVLFYSASSQKVLSDILLNWRRRCGPSATFAALIIIIEERCNWMHIGGKKTILLIINNILELHYIVYIYIIAQMKRNKELCTIEIGQTTKWKDLPACKQCELCTKEVYVFAAKRSLLSFTRGISETVLRSILNDTLNKEKLCQFVDTADFELARSTTPDILPYYVERKVFLQNKINTNIFSSNGTEIFVFEGIERQTINMVAPSNSDISGNQMQGITCRFIVLDEPAHFEQLCQKTNSTVHYIRFQMGNYIWVRTSGNVENILKYKEKPVFMNEDSFIKIHLAKHSPNIFCVAGNSGDGKTTFLANVARKVQKSSSERIVIFISFQYIMSNFSNDDDLSIAKIICIIARYVSSNELGKRIISEVLKNNSYQTELFLDGYDELVSSERDIAKKMLACITNELKNCRIFITANENQYRELEQEFRSITWAMGNFQENDQIKLLNSYWCHFKKIQIKNDMSLFSARCVNLLACSKMLHTIQFVGNTTLTVILAQQYGDFVQDFLRGHLKTFDNRKNYVTSIALYKAFFNGTFKKVSAPTKQMLIQLALEKTFPKMLPDVSPSSLDLTSELFSVGLLQKSLIPNNTEFVHQSYSNYIAIQCLTNHIQELDIKTSIPLYTQMLSFLFQTTTNLENQVTFVNLPLCLVFEAYLLDQSELRKVNARLIFEHVSNQVKTLNKLFLACLNNELYGILCTFIRGALEYAPKLITESSSMSGINHDKLLRILGVASRHVDLKLARKIHKSLQISKTDLFSIHLYKWKPFSITMTSLHFAANQGNMKLFNYILDSMNSSQKQQLPIFLCHVTVYNSKYDLPDIIESKLEILTKLIKITYSQILQEKSDNVRLVHLLTNIHVRLLKYLIESGVDLFAVDSQQNTIAHHIVEYLAADEYHDLVEILLSRNAGSLFRKANRNNETAFLKALRILKLEDKTIVLLLTSKELFTEVEVSPNNTYVYQLIKAGYGSGVLATALECSLNWKEGCFSAGRTSLLHIAVLYQNIEAVKFFLIGVGISANARDESGMTPYHVACSSEFLYFSGGNCSESVEIIKLLLKHGANVRLIDNSNKLPLSYLLGNIGYPTNALSIVG